jgi:hypothetical protein
LIEYVCVTTHKINQLGGGPLISSDHEVQHWGFAVDGGGTYDEFSAALADARAMKLPIGFGEQHIHPVLMDSPAQGNKRGIKKSHKTEVSKSKRGKK